MSGDVDKLEAAAKDLEASGRLKILRRVEIPRISRDRVPARAKKALIIDSETTGLDVKTDHVIELGAVLVAYDRADGSIYGALDIAGGFQDPGVPIPAEVTALTGITDEMVRGQQLDLARFEALIAEADIIVAHHAGFDRPIISKVLTSIRDKPWACSLTGVILVSV